MYKLYDILNYDVLSKWREDEEEKENYVTQKEKSLLDALNIMLDEEGKEMLHDYFLEIENRLDGLHYKLGNKILMLGMELGIDLEKSFAKNKE